MSDWEHIASFKIPGRPVPKGRPRFTRTGHAYTPKTTRDAERKIVDLFEFECPLWEPTREDVRLTVDVLFRGKVTCDADNVFKLVADALNGTAYVDDKQVRKGEFEWFENTGDLAGVIVSFAIWKGEGRAPQG